MGAHHPLPSLDPVRPRALVGGARVPAPRVRCRGRQRGAGERRAAPFGFRGVRRQGVGARPHSAGKQSVSCERRGFGATGLRGVHGVAVSLLLLFPLSLSPGSLLSLMLPVVAFGGERSAAMTCYVASLFWRLVVASFCVFNLQ